MRALKIIAAIAVAIGLEAAVETAGKALLGPACREYALPKHFTNQKCARGMMPRPTGDRVVCACQETTR